MAAGPLIGGTVVEGWNGQAIFWINVPIGLLSVPLVLLALPNSFGARLRAGLVGPGVLRLGVLGLVFGIVRGNPVGWDSFEVVGSLGAGVALLAGFVLWEWRCWPPWFRKTTPRRAVPTPPCGRSVSPSVSPSMSPSVSPSALPC